jgi:hypothetical protein
LRHKQKEFEYLKLRNILHMFDIVIEEEGAGPSLSRGSLGDGTGPPIRNAHRVNHSSKAQQTAHTSRCQPAGEEIYCSLWLPWEASPFFSA